MFCKRIILLVLCFTGAGTLRGRDIVGETSAALCRALDAIDMTASRGQILAGVSVVYDSVMGARRDSLVRHVENMAMREGISPTSAVGPIAWDMLAGVYRDSENFKRLALFHGGPIPQFDTVVVAAGMYADSLLTACDAMEPIYGSVAQDCVKQAMAKGWPIAEKTGRYAIDDSDKFEQQLTQWLLVYSEPFQRWRVRVLPASQNPCMTRLIDFVED